MNVKDLRYSKVEINFLSEEREQTRYEATKYFLPLYPSSLSFILSSLLLFVSLFNPPFIIIVVLEIIIIFINDDHKHNEDDYPCL